MNELSLTDGSGFAADCVLIGEGAPAERIWTKREFLAICEWMMNGNPPHDFLLAHQDDSGAPKFARAKNQLAHRRATWAWDTIIGGAKSKAGLGFYPSNQRHQSRWGALDFDAHDGNAVRARTLACNAFRILHRRTELALVLTTSGSLGWHLFVFSHEYYDRDSWTVLLKQVAARAGGELTSGCCELFPSESNAAALPRGIRAPGTWNPKTDQLGLIVFDSLQPLLARHAFTKNTAAIDFDRVGSQPSSAVYTGGKAEWLRQFAITQPATRHAQLTRLVHTVFRQVGLRVGRRLATQQYVSAVPRPNASLDEHMKEFEELWNWTERMWTKDLSIEESIRDDQLAGQTRRDFFRIVHNFAWYAGTTGEADFPVSVENVGARLGVSFQYVSKLRQEFMKDGILSFTTAAVPNVRPARFRWEPADKSLQIGSKHDVSAISTFS